MDSRSHFYRSSDGLRLHVRVHGDPSSRRTPVVCLPGLTRNARDFEGLAGHLAASGGASRPVLAFDYRGRGLSGYDPDWRNYNLAVESQDVLTGLASLGIERAAFIGTSRGGLILHLLAPMHPTLIEAAILNDVGPELGLDGLSQIRDYLLNRRQPASWAEALAAQKAIHAAAFPILEEADWERMTRALYREQDGRPVLDFDPALVQTLAGLDLTKPLPGLWQQFESLARLPLMVIRGEHSRLLVPQTVQAMKERHPAMQTLTAVGQGHAPLLEAGSLPAAIVEFLDRAEGINAEGAQPS